MNEADSLLEPIKYYKSELKQKHLDNINAYFEKEVKESNINPDVNKEAVNDYNKKVASYNSASKAYKKIQNKMTALLVFGILLCPVIIGIFLLVKRSDVKKNEAQIAARKKVDAENAMNEAKNVAKASVAALVGRIDSHLAPRLMEQTIPFINFDDVFTAEDSFRIEKQYKCRLTGDINESALSLQTGHLNNNPFVLRQHFRTYMGTETYYGTRTITYTVTEHDSNGTHTRVVSQTLHASLTKPKPFYNVGTALDYFTTAAPKLCFSRNPTDLYKKNEKEIAKYIAKVDEEETKKAQKAIKKGQRYTKLANVKFESYFNSANRNNELEYRLLFTPLAQNNLVYYFSQKEPFGDDVYYIKDEMRNTVISNHSSRFDYTGCPYLADEYDYEVIKDKVINYCNDFFTYLYYDFALLLSIPLFNQHLSEKFLEHETKRNFSAMETEVLINKFGPESFKHPDSDTDVILKTSLVSKKGDIDVIDVHAFSYEAIEEIDEVPVVANNGQTYFVPVHYFIYEPLEQVTTINVYNIKEGQPSKSGINYRNMDFEII